MATTWIMPIGAARRLQALPTGPRGLLSAIAQARDTLHTLEWALDTPTLSGRLPSPIPGPAAVYGAHPFLAQVWSERPDLHRAIWWDTHAHSHQAVAARLGTRMLNAQARITTRAEFLDRFDPRRPCFVRPDANAKAANGGVIDSWGAARALPNVPLVVAPLRPILAEYRFIIAQGQVCTGSQYRRAGQMDVRIDTAPAAADLAQEAAGLYSPLPLFVCDVADTPEGTRVVEYNAFSASGLYACDGRAIVAAVHALSSPP